MPGYRISKKGRLREELAVTEPGHTGSRIILASNLSLAECGDLLGSEVLATTLMDRLLHHAEVISINGRS